MNINDEGECHGKASDYLHFQKVPFNVFLK